MAHDEYAYDSTGFTRFSVDDKTGEILASETVSAEEGARGLIQAYLDGRLAAIQFSGGASTVLTTQVTGDALAANPTSKEAMGVVIEQLILEVDADSADVTSFAERLHRVLGDDNRIVRITADTDEIAANNIWGSARVAEARSNDTPPDEPRDPKINAIVATTPDVGPIATGSVGSGDGGAGPVGTGDSPRSDSKTGGDPVVLATGELYHQVTDLTVAGRGLYFSFVRTYRHQTLYKGPLGYGWDHSYNLWLRETTELMLDGSLVSAVYRSTGALAEERFVRRDDATADDTEEEYLPPAGCFERLRRLGGRYQLDLLCGVTVHYNDELMAARLVDRNGNELRLEYTDQCLTSVIDPVGKEFRFDYDELNRIVALFDVIGNRHLRYTYGSNGDLEEVDFVGVGITCSTDYRYAGPDERLDRQHNLEEIINGKGSSVLRVSYGDEPWTDNRVVWQRAIEGEYRYEYGPAAPEVDDGDARALWSTTVFHPNDHVVEHQLDGRGNVVRREESIVLDLGFPSTLVATYRYNEDDLLVHELRPDGASIRYRYRRESYSDGADVADATSLERSTFGNLLQRIETPRAGSGELRVLVTNHTYDGDSARIASVRGPFYATPALVELPDPSVRELHYEYDGRGNLAAIRPVAQRRPDGAMVTPFPVTVSYDVHGSVADVRHGTVRTHYEYFSDVMRSGVLAAHVEDADGFARRTERACDDLGRCTRTIDPFGAVTIAEWNAVDLPVRITWPAVVAGMPPPVDVYVYDQLRLPVRLERECQLDTGAPHPDAALVETFEHDAFGRIKRASTGTRSSPGLRTHAWTYDAFGRVAREIDARGTATRYDHDERGLLASITRALGTEVETTQRFEYNLSGELVAIEDAFGARTRIVRDGFGRPINVIDPDGNEQRAAWSAGGAVTNRSVWGPHPDTGEVIRWAEVDLTHDGLGRLIERLEHAFVPLSPGSAEKLRSAFYYDARGQLEAVVDPAGGRWTLTTDALERITRRVDPVGNEIAWSYDDAAPTVMTTQRTDRGTDPSVIQLFRTRTLFDARGLRAAEIDELGNTVRFRHDSRSLQTAVVDPSGHEVRTEYDVFGAPSAHVTTADGTESRTVIEVDTAGQALSLTAPGGTPSAWTYDALGRVASATRGEEVVTYKYDREGRLLSRRDANGVVIARSYTVGGRLDRVTVDTSSFVPLAAAPGYRPVATDAIELRYTPVGSVARASRGSSVAVVMRDSLDRVVSETIDGRTLAFDWDGCARLTRFAYTDGRALTYRRAADGLLQEIIEVTSGSENPGDPAAIVPRTLARITRIGTRPSATELASSHYEVEYEAGGRANSVTVSHGPTMLFTERSLRGSRGELQLQEVTGVARRFGYDDLARCRTARDFVAPSPLDLTALSPPGTLASPSPVQRDVDEIVTAVDTELAGATGLRRFDYALDLRGNRVRTDDTSGSDVYVPDGLDRYTMVAGRPLIYDRAGNLLDDGTRHYRFDGFDRLCEIRDGADITSIEYDPLGRRVKVVKASRTDEWRHLGAHLVEWRRDGTLVAQLVPHERANQYAQLATAGRDLVPLSGLDHTIHGWATSDGAIEGAITYDPFGARTSGTFLVPLGFGGHWMDSEHEIYGFHVRAYDPRLGRFLSRDPAGLADGTNPYTYARNAPGTLIDRLGFSSTDLDYGQAAWGFGKTAATGAAIYTSTQALIAAGVMSGGTAFVIGGVLLGIALVADVVTRSEEMTKAGRTDQPGRLFLAVAGDQVGATQVVEACVGEDVTSGRRLSGSERGDRLGTGLGTATLLGASLGKNQITRWTRKLRDPMPALRANRYWSAGADAELRVPGKFTSNELGAMGEARFRDLNDLPFIPENDQLSIPSTTGRGSRRLDGPVIPEAEMFGDVFPPEYPQVKYKRALGPDDIGQLVDTLRAARENGAVLGLYLRRGTRWQWNARRPDVQAWLNELARGYRDGTVIIYELP